MIEEGEYRIIKHGDGHTFGFYSYRTRGYGFYSYRTRGYEADVGDGEEGVSGSKLVCLVGL